MGVTSVVCFGRRRPPLDEGQGPKALMVVPAAAAPFGGEGDPSMKVRARRP